MNKVHLPRSLLTHHSSLLTYHCSNWNGMASEVHSALHLSLQILQSVGRLFQLFAKLGVGHIDQGPRPLADRLAV